MDFHEILMQDKQTTLLEALKQLDQSGMRILFVTDEENRLLAALSDGDIRRWIMQQGSLDAPVAEVANFNPKYLFEEEKVNAKPFMAAHRLEALPILDANHKVQDIIFLFDNESDCKEKLNLPVVIMAGGKGTRLYPYTKILPKPLIPIGDIPISEHIINRFYKQGCRDFWFIVNYRKNMIKSYFHEIEKDYAVDFVDEDEPLGTGGGVRLLKGKINSTFVLTNCDTIIHEDFANIYRVHQEHKNLVTMVCSLRNYEVPYGVVNIGANGSIESMEEKPSMSFFTNTGTYIVEPEVMDLIQPGENIGFPDIIQRVKDAGKPVGVYPINENAWLDMGQMDTMENMKEKLHILD